jgi:hypothetical protein
MDTQQPTPTDIYRERLKEFTEKTITLPSGFTYKIRKMTALETIALTSKYNVNRDDVKEQYRKMKDVNRDEKEIQAEIGKTISDKMGTEKSIEMMNDCLMVTVLSPHLSFDRDDPDSICIIDIPVTERTDLYQQCMIWGDESFLFEKKTLTSIPKSSEPSD